MTDVILPGTIFEDAATIHYRRGYRAARLVVHQNILRQAKQQKRLRMRLCAWAMNWGRSVKAVKAIYAQMEADGLCTWTVEGEGTRDDFATFEWSDTYVREEAQEQVEPVPTGPRPRFPSDEEHNERRREERKNGFGGTAFDSATDSANTPPNPPVTGYRFTGPESVLLKTTGTGQPEPEPDGPPGARVEPPVSVVEQFVALGMERPKAEERLREFGEERCRDALDTLAYRRERNVVPKPVGFIVDFLVKGRDVPAALVKRREQAAAAANARGQPKVRYAVRPMEEIPVDPETAAKWHSRVEKIIENGGE
jgi:hypothetical protein